MFLLFPHLIVFNKTAQIIGHIKVKYVSVYLLTSPKPATVNYSMLTY